MIKPSLEKLSQLQGLTCRVLRLAIPSIYAAQQLEIERFFLYIKKLASSHG